MNSLFMGRYQPFHKGHKALIDQALNKLEPVVIALRDTIIDEKNPYTIEERKTMIDLIYGKKVKVITIPDIKKVYIGRDVGYEVIQMPKKIEKISATKIRKENKYDNLPREIINYIKLLDKRNDIS